MSEIDSFQPEPALHENPSIAKLVPANAQNSYEVTRADLPLSCPMPSMVLWNSHPKVYLAVEATGSAKCPYCGAQYTLKD
jgi:uncharacterized Zn-finger protein